MQRFPLDFKTTEGKFTFTADANYYSLVLNLAYVQQGCAQVCARITLS